MKSDFVQSFVSVFPNPKLDEDFKSRVVDPEAKRGSR